MGLVIELQDEIGNVLDSVLDPKDLLHKLFPREAGKGYIILPYIDFYMNTILNQLQMEPFIKELDMILKKAKSKEEKGMLEKIKSFAIKCEKTPHLYIKFIGD